MISRAYHVLVPGRALKVSSNYVKYAQDVRFIRMQVLVRRYSGVGVSGAFFPFLPGAYGASHEVTVDHW